MKRFSFVSYLLFLVILLSLTSTQSFAALDLKGLVGLWLLDDSSGNTVKDSSGNKNDASINGAFKWEKGKFDGCLVASGSGSIDVKTSDSINSVTDAVSVGGWFRVDADSDTGIRRQNAYLLEDQSSSEP
ncbi:MAG: hypothetical protein ACPL7B_16690, partial [Candidatus Poribacteria bacterium]